MKHGRSGIVLLLALAGLTLSAEPSGAVPVFARKYGFNCTMCHSAFPRLNDFGTRYRDNGYRLPGRENDEKTVLEGPAPIAARMSGGYTDVTNSHVDGGENTRRLLMNGVDILSGGVLGPRMGYLVVLPPQIGSVPGLEGQDGTLEMASVLFSDLGSPWLNVRFGRFEPAYVTSSVKRSLSASPYEIYEYGAPGGLLYADTQDGLEVSGHGRFLRYAAGWVGGSPANHAKDALSDFYLRTAAVLGPGEGQTTGQRIGLTGYFGRARPDTSVFPDADRASFYRIGADASLNVRQANLSLQYLYCRDEKELWDKEKSVSYSGGFAELSLMPKTMLALFCRFDWIDAPGGIGEDVIRGTGGVRCYFVDNVAAHVEYSRWQASAEQGPDPTIGFAAARLDFAF